MSYKFSFADNAVYSATDVNNITKRLVTSGVEESFSDGVSYNVSQFNEAGKLLYTSGTVPEGCMSLKVTKYSDNEIIINPGCAFFNDGSVLEIEDGGEIMAYVKDAVNYVYLKNDLLASNVSYPYCGTKAPEGDCVMLAEINIYGTITDKRTYAHGKLPGYQSVAPSAMFLHETVEVDVTEPHFVEGDVAFDIGANNFEYIISYSFKGGENNKENLALYRISDGTIISFYRKSDTDGIFNNTGLCVFSDSLRSRVYATPTIVDGVLKLHIEGFFPNDDIGKAGDVYKLNLDFIFA